MYLYFNKQGKITTAIPHGEPVRQGNMLNLYICLDKDFFSSQNYNPEEWCMQVETMLADGTPGQVLTSTTEMGPHLFKFNKLIDSEVVYDLVPGKIYYRYLFKIDYQYSTKIAGIMKVQVSLYSDNHPENYFGTVDVFVEKTFNFTENIEDNEEISYDKFISDLKNMNLKIQELFASPRRIMKVQKLKEFTQDEVTKLLGPDGDLPIYIISGEYVELTYDTIPNKNFVYKCNESTVIGDISFESGKYYEYNDQWVEIENYEERVGCGYLLKENTEYELIFYGRNFLWANVEERVDNAIDQRTENLVVFYDYTKEEEE